MSGRLSELRYLRFQARDARASIRRRLQRIPSRLREALDPAYLLNRHPRLLLGAIVAGSVVAGAFALRALRRRQHAEPVVPEPSIVGAALRVAGNAFLSVLITGAMEHAGRSDSTSRPDSSCRDGDSI